MSHSLAYQAVQTEDGSWTYRDLASGATYRSTRGAATESRHVFLEGTGLLTRPSPWRVLELGFGTGMNFHTTWGAAREEGVELVYHSLEPRLLPRRDWLVDEVWKEPDRWSTDQVQLVIHQQTWQEHTPEEGGFNAFYHDPFGPGVSPECWSPECFRWALRALSPDGVLATFGAASASRKAMKEAGFLVGIRPGGPGKREMTVASRSARAIAAAKPWKRDD